MMKHIYRRNKADYIYQELPSVAEMVVVQVNQGWYRAKISGINGKQSANVWLIDEGLGQRNLPIKNIFRMHPDLCNYPRQSFPGEFENPITCLPNISNKLMVIGNVFKPIGNIISKQRLRKSMVCTYNIFKTLAEFEIHFRKKK